MPHDFNCRPAAVAGLFYPRQPDELKQQVRDLLATARRPPLEGRIKAIIVPHAGYLYSGPIAASAFAPLNAQRDGIRRVVLLGPVHRVPIRGVALPADAAFETPLGPITVDQVAAERLRALRAVGVSRAAHALEHSLEVQLPFLQEVLDEFAVLPIAVGDATTAEVAQVLEAVWGGAETLIVVSSDLSHYHSYADAQIRDRMTCDHINHLGPELTHDQACGGTPINGLMELARRHRLRVQLLDLRNSGDTAGDRDRVVGYAAFALTTAADVH